MEIKPEIVYRIIDVKDYKLLEKAFVDYSPDIVFHAAAHKHVPLMEYNEIEAVQNNVGGTVNVLELSLKNNIEEFVLISTDKAVNPASIMGATKRIAEIATDYYNKEKGLKTSIVRFGNVIGSRGSVVPLFREQIENGGPVTITHPEIKRYFMSIPEASLLVINAAAYSQGGEMYVLDMGTQYKVLDIAKRLIRLYGYEPEEDIKIKFSGLRPGEKMYEELYYDKEELVETGNDKIFVLTTINGNYDRNQIENFIREGLQSIYKYSPVDLRGMLKKIVPEFEYQNLNEDDCKINKFVN
jgi:FlaA1/EpsC-like NDP-sugar epimerase